MGNDRRHRSNSKRRSQVLGAGWIGVAYFVVTKVIGNLVLTTLLISFVIQAFRYISFVIQALFLPFQPPPLPNPAPSEVHDRTKEEEAEKAKIKLFKNNVMQRFVIDQVTGDGKGVRIPWFKDFVRPERIMQMRRVFDELGKSSTTNAYTNYRACTYKRTHTRAHTHARAHARTHAQMRTGRGH